MDNNRNRNPMNPLNALINRTLAYLFSAAIIVTVIGVIVCPVVLAVRISPYWLFTYPVYLVVVAMVALAFRKDGNKT